MVKSVNLNIRLESEESRKNKSSFKVNSKQFKILKQQFKNLMKNIYLFPLSSKEKINFYQKIARDAEWEAFKAFIKPKDKLLDIGCGTGYFLNKSAYLGCECYGIDEEPLNRGVIFDTSKTLHIEKGTVEDMPFEANKFDVVMFTHVFQFVKNKEKALNEIARVLKPNGLFIIGVPTSVMALISIFSQLFFTTHIRVYNAMFNKSREKKSFIKSVMPKSHFDPNKTAFADIKEFSVSNWKQTIEKQFQVKHVLYPALYPYPDYIQLFSLKSFKRISSSVYFICTK